MSGRTLSPDAIVREQSNDKTLGCEELGTHVFLLTQDSSTVADGAQHS